MIVVNADTEEQPTLGFLLVRLGEAVDRRFVAALASLELRPRELRALVLIDRHPGSTQRALARRMPSDPGNSSRCWTASRSRAGSHAGATRTTGAVARSSSRPRAAALLERAIAASAEAEREVLAPLKDRERAALEAIALRLWRAT